MSRWKKISLQLLILFIVSAASSWTTRYFLTSKQPREVSWKETLHLTSEQEKKFSELELELNSVLKESAYQESQDKISLCSYLHEKEMDETRMKSNAKSMAEIYQKRQEKVAATLASISGILNPEQKKIFSQKLMHEICISCKTSTGQEKCLCGMCGA